jgi:heptosyltransferase-2/heptosyltransferase-3
MLSKRWPAARYAALARQLKGDGVSVLLSGGADDAGLAAAIADDAGLPASAILAGKADIATLAAILDHASVYVGPDTGVSHIAAATGTPTVTIFGPTNPRRYRPLGPDVTVLAPPQSWEIPDRDLRGVNDVADAVSTDLVSVESVLVAARSAIDRGQRVRPCND